MHPNLLDQLNVFESVTEHGSFSAAARSLNRTVSAITYTITQLEQQLGLTLFDRSQYRPQLTAQGQSLRRDCAMIMRRVERFDARVASMKAQQPVQIRLAVTPLFPLQALAQALTLWHQQYPHIGVSLEEMPEAQALSGLQDDSIQLAFVQLHDTIALHGFDGQQLFASEMKLVTSPQHPLAQNPNGIRYAELDDHQQIIISSDSIDEGDYRYGVSITNLWQTNTLELQKQLLCAGAGWGYLADFMIAPELANGQLCALQCADIAHWPQVRFAAGWSTRRPPTATLQQLLNFLSQQLAGSNSPSTAHNSLASAELSE